jgi:glycosyltransferase involved in cell wall biosynthesis
LPPSADPRPLLLVLPSLEAEGCPQLALLLARHWIRLGQPLALLCLAPQPAVLRPEFEALAVPIHTLVLGSGPLRYPRLLARTFALCRALRPRALLCFLFGWHALIALAARLAGVPRLCAHVGNPPPSRQRRRMALLVQLGRPFTHRLLCCSRSVARACRRSYGLRRGETRTVANACDLAQLLQLPPAPPAAPPLLAMVARLEAHKDHPTLLRALALLRDQGLTLRLWLIGDGSRRPQLEALIHTLGLSAQVELLGSRRDIPRLLAQLDLFVFAAGPDEGFGIALAEAMAAGVPVVATAVPACRELLAGGRCGLLVPPASPAALAAAIRAALADPAAARRRAAAARRRARRRYGVPAMARAYGQELGLA